MPNIKLSPSQWEKLREAVALTLKLKTNIQIDFKANLSYWEPIAEAINRNLNNSNESSETLNKVRSKKRNTIESNIGGDMHFVSSTILQKLLYLTWKRPAEFFTFRDRTVKALCLFAYAKFGFIENSPIVFPKNAKTFEWNQNFPLNQENLLEETVHIEPRLKYRAIKELFGRAKNRITILETFIENWVNYSTELKKVATKGCKVEILLMDPNSPIVERRFEGLGRTDNPYTQNQTSLKTIRNDISSWGDAQKNISIFLYNQLPGMSVYGADGTYYCGWFWIAKQTMEGPYLKITPNNRLYQEVERHLRKLKEDSIDAASFVPDINMQYLGSLNLWVGDWWLYCHKSKKNQKTHELAGLEAGVIAKNHLKIYEEEIYAYTNKCSFRDSSGNQYLGKAYQKTASFICCELQSKDGKRQISLLLHKGSGIENHLIGIFNTIYPEDPILGTGLIVISKIDPVEISEKKLPKTQEFNPNKIPAKLNQNQKAIIRYLLFTLGSRMNPLREIDDLYSISKFKQGCKYKGVYRVFSYYKARGEDTRYILEGILRITEYYTAIHKRMHPEDPKKAIVSHGKVDVLDDGVLSIRLENPFSKRTGTYLLASHKKSPVKEKTVYAGIFSGVSRTINQVIGLRTVFVYQGNGKKVFDKLKPTIHALGSESFIDLPEGIQETLSGRIPNLISFLRRKHILENRDLKKEADKAVNIGKLFYQSACFYTLQKNLPKIKEMLKRMEEHHYMKKPDFENQLNTWVKEDIISHEYKEEIITLINQ